VRKFIPHKHRRPYALGKSLEPESITLIINKKTQKVVVNKWKDFEEQRSKRNNPGSVGGGLAPRIMLSSLDAPAGSIN